MLDSLDLASFDIDVCLTDNSPFTEYNFIYLFSIGTLLIINIF